MPVKLNSTGGGSVTLDTPSTASNYTITLPAATSTLLDTTSTQTLTNKTLTAAGSNTVEATSGPTSTQLAGMRNKIINGAMMIDQRNAGASVTITTDGTYCLDRWAFSSDAASKYSVQQSATAPAGYTNSIAITSLSAYSVSSNQVFGINQYIEGLNCADLSWGTASAATVTLSFSVNCSLAGTFGGVIRNSAGNRSYPFTYTISSANTWERKTVTIAGDTTGTWLTTNGVGMRLIFGLGVGSTYSGTAGAWAAANYYGATGATSVVGTNGATFYITGVQLEKGATATPFENRLYGTELALCQRYYQYLNSSNAPYSIVGVNGQGNNIFSVWYPVSMRSSPTATITNSTTPMYSCASVGGAQLTVAPTAFGSNASPTGARFYTTTPALTGSSGLVCWLDAGNGNFLMTLSAEL